MKIVCPDGDPRDKEMLDPEKLEKLQQTGSFTWYEGKPNTTEELISRVQDAEGVMVMWDFPKEAMLRCENVKIICYPGTGVNKYIDLETANKLDILVCNVPNYGANAIAEHTIALMFGLARKITFLDRDIRNGKWSHPFLMELRNKVIGLLGLGSIGTRVAKLANALEMKVICWTRNPSPQRACETGVEFVSFTDLFRKADIVSIHLHHNTETERIIGKKELDLMKKGSFIINTSRGEVIDTNALIYALENKNIAGAALDVFDEEPLPAGHILTKLTNVILTPHIAYNTPETTKNILDISLDNFIQYQKGLPVNAVNYEILKNQI